ncbi:MAG: hypothetical protein RR440_00415 [Erysipelotrichaceae bacterium]
MSKKERLELFLEIKGYNIKMKDIAGSCEISPAQLSRFFNNQINMSEDRIERVIKYIEKVKEGKSNWI